MERQKTRSGTRPARHKPAKFHQMRPARRILAVQPRRQNAFPGGPARSAPAGRSIRHGPRPGGGSGISRALPDTVHVRRTVSYSCSMVSTGQFPKDPNAARRAESAAPVAQRLKYCFAEFSVLRSPTGAAMPGPADLVGHTISRNFSGSQFRACIFACLPHRIIFLSCPQI